MQYVINMTPAYTMYSAIEYADYQMHVISLLQDINNLYPVRDASEHSNTITVDYVTDIAPQLLQNNFSTL